MSQRVEGEYRQVVVRLAGTAANATPLVGAEIGVAEGKTSEMLLRACPRLTLHMVDPWLGDRDVDDCYWQSGDDQARKTQREMDAQHDAAIRRTAAFSRSRAIIHHTTSLAVAATVPDDSLSFVFIDGDHTEPAVYADSQQWWRKLRPDGLMIWHDYGNYLSVGEAVRRFVAGLDLWYEHDDKLFLAWAHKTAKEE